ncbi:MAG: TetR/AcrR family transcriptional regulator [Sandaracinaceae bacterium]
MARASVRVASAPTERPGAPGGKRDRNRRERTTALGQTALALFLARGIEVVTIDDICRAADVAKGSFYRYFEDKEALVEALVAPVDQAVRAALDGCEARLREARDEASLQAAYQGLALALLPVALGHLDVLRLYLQERSAPAVGARAPLAALARTIDEGAIRLTRVAVDHGLLAVGDPRISAYAVVGAIERLAHAVLDGSLDASPIDILTTLIRLVLEGIRTRPERRRT